MRTLTVLSLAIPIFLQACILGLLLWRGLQRRFPWFFIYVAYVLVEAVIKLVVSDSVGRYARFYWAAEIGEVVLMLLALGESFVSVFWAEIRLRWFNWAFWSCIGVALAYGCSKALLPSQEAGRLMTVILDVEFALAAVISAFGLLYAAGVRLFGMVEHQRETGIIFGFGINATLTVSALVIRSTFGTKVRFLTDWIPAVAYIIAECIWAGELMHPERKLPVPDDATLVQMNQAIERYIAIMHRYLGKEER